MNIDDAILAHARWKIRLVSYLRKPDGSINIADLESDSCCDLGKWINGEASQTAAPSDLAALKAVHAKFHRAAANAVRQIDKGAKDADALLGLQSEFGAASLGVVNNLKTLVKKIA